MVKNPINFRFVVLISGASGFIVNHNAPKRVRYKKKKKSSCKFRSFNFTGGGGSSGNPQGLVLFWASN